MKDNNIIELYPSVMGTPLFKATKRILAYSREVAQKEETERGLLFCLSVLEKNNVKLEVVK